MNTYDAVSLIAKIREKSNRLIGAEMAKHGVDGIVTSHGDIIYALFGKPTLTMAEIARIIDKDKSTVTVLIDKLVRLGYVTKERHMDDSRIFNVALTQKGHELKPVFESISKQLLDVFYLGITDHEKEELLRILMKIYHNF